MAPTRRPTTTTLTRTTRTTRTPDAFDPTGPGRRVMDHPVLGPLQPIGPQMVPFVFDGREYQGIEGEPIAAALLAAGVRALGHSERSGRPRGVFCGIGHCYECRVTVDGESNVRSCLTPLRRGMVVQPQSLDVTAPPEILSAGIATERPNEG